MAGEVEVELRAGCAGSVAGRRQENGKGGSRSMRLIGAECGSSPRQLDQIIFAEGRFGRGGGWFGSGRSRGRQPGSGGNRREGGFRAGMREGRRRLKTGLGIRIARRSGRRGLSREQVRKEFRSGFGLGAKPFHQRAFQFLLVGAQMLFAAKGSIFVAGKKTEFFTAM